MPVDRRILLQAYVPRLQTVGQVCTFLRWEKRFKIPSSAAFRKIGEAFVKSIRSFAKKHDIPVVRFAKGEKKEEIARPYVDAAKEAGHGKVVLIGIAQEKAVFEVSDTVVFDRPQAGAHQLLRGTTRSRVDLTSS